MTIMSDEWGTPPCILDFIQLNGTCWNREIFTDPCNGKRGEFTSSDGGLVVLPDRPGLSFFVNPPFSEIEDWFTRVMGGQYGSTGFFVMPDWTDRHWFMRNQCDILPRTRFIGRINYIPLSGQKKSSPTFGTALIAFGDFSWNPEITWPESLASRRRPPRRRRARQARPPQQ